MTDREWLSCSNPLQMLDHMGDRASRRKRELCALACFESSRSALKERPPWSANTTALDVLQRLPEEEDWHESDSEQEAAWGDVDSAMSNRFWEHGARTWAICRDEDLWDAVQAGSEAALTDWNDPEAVEAGVTSLVTGHLVYDGYLYSLYGLYPQFPVSVLAPRLAAHAEAAGAEPSRIWAARMRLFSDFVRDIFGNPFRSIAIHPSWLTWHGGLLVSMARQMYDSRDFTDMPILADALEDAACTNQDLLDHCRSGGEHVRGCWVVDALLGKS